MELKKVTGIISPSALDNLLDQLEKAEAKIRDYEEALKQIANEDYRGNRSPASVNAHKVLAKHKEKGEKK